LAVEKALVKLAKFAASWAVMLAEWAAANKANRRCHHETATHEIVLANDAKA
jgi:hypothetical protein